MKQRGVLLLNILMVFVLIFTAGCSQQENVSLGEYKGIEVDVERVLVTDEDVESALMEEIEAVAPLVEVADRNVAEYGDYVNIDYTGTMDGQAIGGGSDTDYAVEIGSGSFISGFEEQIIGMETGQTKVIQVTYPDPYTVNEAMSGKDAEYTITLNSILYIDIPEEITDDWIPQISEDYNTVEAYRAYIRETLQTEADETNLSAMKSAVWEAVLTNCTVASLLEDRVNAYVVRYRAGYEEQALEYGISLQEYLSEYLSSGENMTIEQLDESLVPYGEMYVKSQMIVEAIAEKEGLSISDEEYDAYVEEQAVVAELDTDAFEEEYGSMIIENALFDKVQQFLVDNAVVK